jgi:hypothetical protein
MNMTSDLRTAILAFLALIALLSVGCGQQEDLVNGNAVKSPFITDYWLDVKSNESMELIGVRVYSETSLVFGYPNPSGAGTVRCSVNAVLRGDSKSGTIQVSSPDGFAITPENMSTTPCEWLKTATRYGIIGEQLTISYDSNQKMRVFAWNPAR